jgi:hypothetical protein
MTNEVDLILERAGKLSADETLILMQKLMINLRNKIKPKQSENEEKINVGLVYGKYKNSGGRMSSEEDFKLAEYHFNEDDWK